MVTIKAGGCQPRKVQFEMKQQLDCCQVSRQQTTIVDIRIEIIKACHLCTSILNKLKTFISKNGHLYFSVAIQCLFVINLSTYVAPYLLSCSLQLTLAFSRFLQPQLPLDLSSYLLLPLALSCYLVSLCQAISHSSISSLLLCYLSCLSLINSKQWFCMWFYRC